MVSIRTHKNGDVNISLHGVKGELWASDWEAIEIMGSETKTYSIKLTDGREIQITLFRDIPMK